MDPGIVALMGLAALTVARTELTESATPPLIVRVYEHDAVSPATLERGQSRLQEVMSRAGLQLQWRECPQHPTLDVACAAPPAPNEAIVRLRPSAASVPLHGCGVTLVPDAALAHFVTLFVDCIRDASDRLHLPEDVVFAGALAHELAHVLLGATHAGSGLLQARPRSMDWMRFAHHGLMFTAEEGRRMREALYARHDNVSMTPPTRDAGGAQR